MLRGIPVVVLGVMRLAHDAGPCSVRRVEAAEQRHGSRGARLDPGEGRRRDSIGRALTQTG